MSVYSMYVLRIFIHSINRSTQSHSLTTLNGAAPACTNLNMILCSFVNPATAIWTDICKIYLFSYKHSFLGLSPGVFKRFLFSGWNVFRYVFNLLVFFQQHGKTSGALTWWTIQIVTPPNPNLTVPCRRSELGSEQGRWRIARGRRIDRRPRCDRRRS